MKFRKELSQLPKTVCSEIGQFTNVDHYCNKILGGPEASGNGRRVPVRPHVAANHSHNTPGR